MKPFARLLAASAALIGSDSNTQRRMMSLSLAARRKVWKLFKLEEKNHAINSARPFKRDKSWRLKHAPNPFARRSAIWRYRLGIE